MPETIRGLSRIHVPGLGSCLGVVTDQGVRVDGTSAEMGALLARCRGPAEWQQTLAELSACSRQTIAVDTLAPGPDPERAHLLAPVGRQECWGAGCTYRVEQESLRQMWRQRPLYAAAYEADRPLLFFKGSPQRVAGPGAAIFCRPGAARTIPEAELAVLFAPTGQPLAFALANDVTALDLEQQNSLYQPQAKVFDGGVALGPLWTSVTMAPNAISTPFSCTVMRDGRPVLKQQIDPQRLVRSVEELSRWLFEASSFPEGVVLLTGGGAAVPPGFALAEGDLVAISHPDLGELRNPVASSCLQNPTINQEESHRSATQV